MDKKSPMKRSSTMEDQPPPKRSRFTIFSIANILGLISGNDNNDSPSTSEQQVGDGHSKKAADYVERLETTIEHNKKFKFIKSRSKFMIKDLPRDPEGLLSGIFQFFLDEAVDESRKRGMKAEQLGCVVTSPLLDHDIWVPVRDMNENSVEAILNRFLLVAQSFKQKDVTLWGQPFEVIATVVDKSSLPIEHQLPEAGRRLAAIRNDDSFCLFYSLVATLAHGIFNWHWEKFSRYLRSEHGMANKFKNDTIELTESVGAPMDLGSYNAEYWVPHVVDFWNNKYAGQHIIKVFIFGSLGHYEPEYKYGPDNFDTPIILYYKDEHFDEEKKTGGLFGQPYCLYCEKVYERDITHKISCKARCLKCARVGPGFPCKMVAAFNKICQLCSKIFYNNNCYQHHLQSGFCRVSKQCEKCGVVWNVNENECQVFGEHRVITFSHCSFNGTKVDKMVISPKPLEAFIEWILNDLPQQYDTVAFSHFGGRFDMVLVFKELFLRGYTPEMLKKGNKMYEMKLLSRGKNKGSIFFRDSFNLMPMSLASLVPAFGLQVEDKPFFPHLANNPNNYGKNIFPTSFLQVSKGIDVLREAMTIASACMKLFRTNHLKADHVGIVPERGYDNAENQSRLALKFLEWYAEENGVEIQTAYSTEGEKRVGNYRLDGWVESQQLGIEINGCCWHGCIKCYPDDNIVLPNGKAAGRQREMDKKRLDFIKSRVQQVEVYWECEILEMLKKDKDMQQKFNNYIDNGPIDIRSAFFGGRTGPLKLFHRAQPGEKISYYDVTSLYPYINVSTSYPTGHPTVHILNEDVCWTNARDNKYELAILKVFVIPPRKIDVPILPVKFDDRLLFPLCGACARLFPQGAVNEDYSCDHEDRDRGWVPNKGKRTQAKLCLNNLWGRFSLRNFGLSQCTITDRPSTLRKMMDDVSKEVSGVDELTPLVVLISHLTKKDWVEEHECSNVVISLWTTSMARLHLLKAMQQVVRTPGCTLLYTDTDSLIFSHPEGGCPLELGPHLGQFTDEYPRHEILEYCSGGAKQYGLKLQKKDQPDADLDYVLKVRGMPLNWDVVNRQGLRYETFKEKVLAFVNDGYCDPINIVYPHFLKPSVKKGSVFTKPLQKKYRPFVGKGVIRQSDFSVLDFGYNL
uniref:DNA-directed DNA polymerase n=1 Tax=Meloidogyne hapla TaxID=6305 RepID=A0A1I8BQI9_MELHA